MMSYIYFRSLLLQFLPDNSIADFLIKIAAAWKTERFIATSLLLFFPVLDTSQVFVGCCFI